MTPELDARWKARLSPFDGKTISIYGAPTPEDALDMLHFIGTILRDRYEEILCFDDWHEHDGFLTNPKTTNWRVITSWWQDTSSLVKSSPGDDYVRKAIFSPTFDWLLRWSLDSTDSTRDDAVPYLDFTAAAESPAVRLIDRIAHRWPDHTTVSSAAAHFDTCYAG